MNPPHTPPEVPESWTTIRKETERTALQFRERILGEVRIHSLLLGIELSDTDVFEVDSLDPRLPEALTSVILESRRVLLAFEELLRSFPADNE